MLYGCRSEQTVNIAKALPNHLLEGLIRSTLDALEAAGKTVVVVLSGKQVMGLIALRDEPRDDATAGVARLQTLGIRTVMLTGDNRRTAAAIAEQIGVEADADLLPDAKLSEIDAMKVHGGVAMVGDGINDAPALAASSVGIAMGGDRRRVGDGGCCAPEKPRERSCPNDQPVAGDDSQYLAEHCARSRLEGNLPRHHTDWRDHALDGDPRRHRRNRSSHDQCAPASALRHGSPKAAVLYVRF